LYPGIQFQEQIENISILNMFQTIKTKQLNLALVIGPCLGVEFTNILRAKIPKVQKIMPSRQSFWHFWDLRL